MRGHFVRFKLVEERWGRNDEVEDVDSRLGYLMWVSVDFRLENHSSDWLVYDVVIDGASTVRNYRTQFGRIIRSNAYAGLVEKMKQKALTVKWFEKTAPATALLPTDTSDSR
jgi:hypothetical protein